MPRIFLSHNLYAENIKTANFKWVYDKHQVLFFEVLDFASLIIINIGLF